MVSDIKGVKNIRLIDHDVLILVLMEYGLGQLKNN